MAQRLRHFASGANTTLHWRPPQWRPQFLSAALAARSSSSSSALYHLIVGGLPVAAHSYRLVDYYAGPISRPSHQRQGHPHLLPFNLASNVDSMLPLIKTLTATVMAAAPTSCGSGVENSSNQCDHRGACGTSECYPQAASAQHLLTDGAVLASSDLTVLTTGLLLSRLHCAIIITPLKAFSAGLFFRASRTATPADEVEDLYALLFAVVAAHPSVAGVPMD